ncbi:MAG: putative metal-dependent hydrolase, TIM-barrel fold [Hyphomicrobiales bacterium]|nr:putative metal-dependent hydrolase, TIM-barrel fold [Hyphomicrobiales bacterium]
MSVLQIPAGACDSHCHIIGPSERFKPAGFAGDVADAPFARHQAMLARIGVSRALIVQPSSVYDSDHAVVLDALHHAPDAYRGVAVADRHVSDEQLAAWHAAGIRALRFIEVRAGDGGRFAGSVGLEDLQLLAPRLKALGMHAQLWAACSDIIAHEKLLLGLGIDVVLDHMGKPDTARGTADTNFHRLCDLVRDGRLWVKLSLCRNSQQFPDYPDLRPFHDALIKADPDKLVWGSDWPHLRMGPLTPDPVHLLDLFLEWTGDQAIITRILATNPAHLFGFSGDASSTSTTGGSA